jgi:uncharacterized protein YgiM (DUF1202 family)
MSSAGCTLVLLLVIAADVQADPRLTTAAVTVRKRPGEKAAAVAKLPAGTEVVVLREEGRWLLVRAGSAEGYLTRSTVSPVPPAVAARGTSWGAAYVTDALRLEVAVDSAILHDAPSPSATVIAKLARGSVVLVADATTTPGWVRASDSGGHVGWLARRDVANPAAAASSESVEGSKRSAERTYRRSRPDGASLRVEAGIGVRTFGMDLTSNASGGLTNFIVDATAVTTSVRTLVTVRQGKRWFAGIDASLLAGAASPGIEYPGPSSAPGTIPFRTIAAEAGGRVGLRAEAFDLAVRVAGHYDAFLPDVENVGTLPRERLLGVMAGARVDIAPADSRVAAEVRFDALVAGSRAQTPGLEDGASSQARAMTGGMTLRFSLGRRWALFGDYDFGRVTTSWTGMSARQPGVTGARRVDTTQTLHLGVSAEL